MVSAIQTISTQFLLNISVNCYLVSIDDGFVLIDTGRRANRTIIERLLEAAGVKPGNLRLIILTHGDFDHSGNAAYFKRRFCVEDVTMHVDDTLMVERGDMFWNRKQPNFLVRGLMGMVFRLRKEDRIRPDFYVKDGEDLSIYGFRARVIRLPGHSRGSIGILTAERDLFCGDLLANTDRPAMWSLMDDPVAARNSVAKVKRLGVNMVYPGHGRPFSMQAFMQAEDATKQGELGEVSRLVVR